MFRLSRPLLRAGTALAVAVAVLTALVMATPLHAQSTAQASTAEAGPGAERHLYDVTLRGIRAAAVEVEAERRGNGYRARLRVETTGLGSAIRRVRFEARAEGRLRAGGPAPLRYAEDADTGKRKTHSLIEYRSGVPVVVEYRAERDHRLTTVDPATQGGTLDPMTSLWWVMRDVPVAEACKAAVITFDGRRRSQTRLLGAEAQGDRLVCRGEYRRLEGFAPDDMAERQRFPFRLTYAPIPDGRMRVVEASLDTQYGTARLIRR